MLAKLKSNWVLIVAVAVVTIIVCVVIGKKKPAALAKVGLAATGAPAA